MTLPVEEELRRVRAALEEAGHDGSIAFIKEDPDGRRAVTIRHGYGFMETAWRAFSVACPGELPCLACWRRGKRREDPWQCLSLGTPLARDCGLEGQKGEGGANLAIPPRPPGAL